MPQCNSSLGGFRSFDHAQFPLSVAYVDEAGIGLVCVNSMVED